MLRIALALSMYFITVAVSSQTSAASVGFPPDAQPLTAETLQGRLTGKEFHVPLADGSWWRLKFQSGGVWSINTSRGHKNDGAWRVEGSQMCSEPKGSRAGCNEMRLVGDALYLKRDSGEVVKFEPR